MTVAEKYQFFLELPSSGSLIVKPVNDSLQWQWRRVDNKRYHRRELANKLMFANNAKEGIKDFDIWYKLEKARQRCDLGILTINSTCDGVAAEDYKGQATVLDAEIDAGACTAEVKFAPNDGYSCIHNNWEEEINILPVTTPRNASVFTGDIEISTQYFVQIPGRADDIFNNANFKNSLVTTNFFGTIDLNEGWTVWRRFFVFVSAGDPNDPDIGTWELEMYYVRERVNQATEPPGYGWVDIGGAWARPLATTVEAEVISHGYYRQDYKSTFAEGELGIDNGRYLNDILQYFFQRYCDLPLVSNFFGINADATNPDNEPYTKAQAVLHELMVFAKDDIIRNTGDENADTLIMTLKKLLEMLQIIFNVEYRVIDDKIYLEHYSYFQPDLMLDLTQEKWADSIKDSFKWSYNKDEIPSKEQFEWEEKTDAGTVSYDFDARSIDYSADCFTDADPVVLRADVVMTNITALIEDGDIDNWNITDKSFVLVATDDGDIIREPGVQSGTPHLNGSLAWANLIPVFHKHGRPYIRGKIHGITTEFTTARKIKKQAPINIRICCEDMRNFDPDRMLVKTQLGFGEIESATYNDPPGELTLQLVFD